MIFSASLRSPACCKWFLPPPFISLFLPPQPFLFSFFLPFSKKKRRTKRKGNKIIRKKKEEPSLLTLAEKNDRHCANTPKTQNAPWYIAAAGQSLALGPSVHSTPGFCGSAKHDALLATMAWVEKGEAPDSLIATKWRDGAAGVRLDAVERQRPLCRWPGKAVWDGVGGVDLAASWKCVEGAF